MFRRRLAVIAVLIVVVVIGIVAWEYTRPVPVINQERARLIESGMSESQVIEILGGAPGDYAGNQLVTYARGGVGADESLYYVGANWWGLEGMIQVHFNNARRVEQVDFYPARFTRQADAWQTIRSVATLQWKRHRHDWVPATW